MLKNTFFVVSSGVTTVVSTLLALEDKTEETIGPAVTPCDLSEAQVRMVQSVMHNRDRGCMYNLTFDAVLAMGGH